MKTDELDARVQQMLEDDVAQARATLTSFKESCRKCRALVDEFVRRTIGSAIPSDYGMVQKPGDTYDAWYCPDCGRCVHSRD